LARAGKDLPSSSRAIETATSTSDASGPSLDARHPHPVRAPDAERRVRKL